MDHGAKTILMIAEKFPPHATSGTPRSLYFARHLPDFGYRPVVMAAPVLSSEPSDDKLLEQVPAGIEIWRPIPTMKVAREAMKSALDKVWPKRPRMKTILNGESAGESSGAKAMHRGAGIKQQLARVQKDVNWLVYWHLDWLPPAFLRGLDIARRHPLSLIWVTAPHVKNLVVGYALAQALRKPLVVDLRDPWTYGSLWQPSSALMETLERSWARTILAAAARVVLTSPLTQHEMELRHPYLVGKCVTITNGFSAEEAIEPLRDGYPGKCLFRYSGVLNARRRPDILLEGLQLALERDPKMRRDIYLEFVGDMAGHESKFENFKVADCVSARGRVSREASLALMRGADVNVLLQTITTGVDVIAGKTFDYLAARKPILGIVDLNGGDAWLLGQLKGNVLASCASKEDIAKGIVELHGRWRGGKLTVDAGDLAKYERRNLTQRLAAEFDALLTA